MRVQEFSEKGAFLEWEKGFSTDFSIKGTFFMISSYFDMRFPCNGRSKSFMVPFKCKGIVLLLILETYHAQILD